MCNNISDIKVIHWRGSFTFKTLSAPFLTFPWHNYICSFESQSQILKPRTPERILSLQQGRTFPFESTEFLLNSMKNRAPRPLVKSSEGESGQKEEKIFPSWRKKIPPQQKELLKCAFNKGDVCISFFISFNCMIFDSHSQN